MISGWHVTRLPVRVVGSTHSWRVVEEVVVSWPELAIEGFLLASRPFRPLFLPTTDALAVTPFGLEIVSPDQVVRRNRSWRKHVIGLQRQYKNRPVVDERGVVQGRLKDFLFDEGSMRLTHLIVSRGILGDLISGALVIPVKAIRDLTHNTIKIQASGES